MAAALAPSLMTQSSYNNSENHALIPQVSKSRLIVIEDTYFCAILLWGSKGKGERSTFILDHLKSVTCVTGTKEIAASQLLENWFFLITTLSLKPAGKTSKHFPSFQEPKYVS